MFKSSKYEDCSLIWSYMTFNFFRSPSRGEREPVRPGLNERSLHNVSVSASNVMLLQKQD